MSITTKTQQIQCTGLDTEGDRCTFYVTILERHLKHLIVQKGQSKLIFNKQERSLRRQTTGKLCYIAVMRTSLKNRYLR
jgi:hypothetical protein